jgi:hypothetical protein
MAARISTALTSSILAATTFAFGNCSAGRPAPHDPGASAGGSPPAAAPEQPAASGPPVSVTPDTLALGPGANVLFSASVSPVTWSVREGAAGGTIDARGRYRAPSAPGTYHVIATSVADRTRSASAAATVTQLAALDGERRTVWSPGVLGGIPVRRSVCAAIDAATYGNGQQDASATIQKAIDECGTGMVVELGPGTFLIDKRFLLISKDITLRGAGATRTFLKRTNGAVKGSYTPKVAEPVIIVGPNRWPKLDDTTSQPLTADGAMGALSVTVADGTGFAPGQIVLLDEDDYETGSWKSLPKRGGAPTSVRIWATDRVAWQKHNPPEAGDDPFPAALSWFSRKGRPIAETKEVAFVEGNTVTFTSPLHIGYRESHRAELTRDGHGSEHVRGAGIEDLSVSGGSDGNIRFEAAAHSWMKDVDDTMWLGEGVAIDRSFRIEVRGSYIHDGAFSEPGGGGYAISLALGASEVLVEDDVVMGANKVMVARSSGAGSVVGYNYMDDGQIASIPKWQEVGINASHMAGSHHVLFEGNESFNYDADCTHGNAIYHTVFRNHLTGIRRHFDDTTGGNVRTAALNYGAWWHSFIGNVLGNAGKMTGWRYEDLGDAPGDDAWLPGAFIWKLGYDSGRWAQAADPQVLGTVVRHGNFDYLNNKTIWDPRIADHSIPSSLYLTKKPQFFDHGRGYVWPWVDPNATPPVRTLPARARYEAGTPFVQP